LLDWEAYSKCLSTLPVEPDTAAFEPSVAYLVEALRGVLPPMGSAFELCRSIERLRYEVVFGEDSTDIAMAKLFALASGLYRLGMTSEAMQWADTLEARDSTGAFRHLARRLRLLRAASNGDSMAVVWMAKGWRLRPGEGEGAEEVTRATAAALVAVGAWEELEAFLERFRNPQPDMTYFRILLLERRRRPEEARRATTDALLQASRASVALRWALLWEAAKLDARIGRLGLAEKELRALLRIAGGEAARLVRMWLAMVQTKRSEYERALSNASASCEEGGKLAKTIPCALADYLLERTKRDER